MTFPRCTGGPSLAGLCELRIRYRFNLDARALVDRCIALVARAQDADDAVMAALESEAREIADGLALRFGAPNSVVQH